MFMLVGGKPEAGESPAETAAREVQEEVGLTLSPGDFAPLGEFREAAANEEGRMVFSHSFIAPPELTHHVRPHREIAQLRSQLLDSEPPCDMAPLLATQIMPALRSDQVFYLATGDEWEQAKASGFLRLTGEATRGDAVLLEGEAARGRAMVPEDLAEYRTGRGRYIWNTRVSGGADREDKLTLAVEGVVLVFSRARLALHGISLAPAPRSTDAVSGESILHGGGMSGTQCVDRGRTGDLHGENQRQALVSSEAEIPLDCVVRVDVRGE